jgi:hypothetical protein
MGARTKRQNDVTPIADDKPASLPESDPGAGSSRGCSVLTRVRAFIPLWKPRGRVSGNPHFSDVHEFRRQFCCRDFHR